MTLKPRERTGGVRNVGERRMKGPALYTESETFKFKLKDPTGRDLPKPHKVRIIEEGGSVETDSLMHRIEFLYPYGTLKRSENGSINAETWDNCRFILVYDTNEAGTDIGQMWDRMFYAGWGYRILDAGTDKETRYESITCMTREKTSIDPEYFSRGAIKAETLGPVIPRKSKS